MAARAGKTVVINRRLESVFEFVLNGANNRLWKPSVLAVRSLDDPPHRVGAWFEQEVMGPEGRLPCDYRITELQPNALIGTEVIRGAVRWKGRYEFRPAGAGTELSYTLEYEPAEGIQQVLEDEVGTLDQLKSFLEKIA